MSSPTGVQRHFDDDSTRFDAIYGDRKTAFESFVDTKIRGVVVDRLRLTRVLAPLPDPWSVLDVGCGSGRYGLALVEDGAARAVGIDFAPKMIEIAREATTRSTHPERLEWHVGDWLGFESSEKFDVVLAMGYFDYVREPVPHVQKMVGCGRVRLMASFPKRWEWRVPIRVVRFGMSGSYVRFYDRAEVEAIADRSGIAPARRFVLDFGRDWLLFARLGD